MIKDYFQENHRKSMTWLDNSSGLMGFTQRMAERNPLQADKQKKMKRKLMADHERYQSVRIENPKEYDS